MNEARPLPAQVKWALWQTLAAKAQGGIVPTIVGLHSLCFDDVTETVDVLFDISPASADGVPMHVQFPRPVMVARDEVHEFVIWLAFSDQHATKH